MGPLKCSRESTIREDMGIKRVTFLNNMLNDDQFNKVEGFDGFFLSNCQIFGDYDKTPIKYNDNKVSAVKLDIFSKVESKSLSEEASKGNCADIQSAFFKTFKTVDPHFTRIEKFSERAADKNTYGDCDETFGHFKEDQTSFKANRNTPACVTGNEYHGGMPRSQTQHEQTQAPNVYQNKHDSHRSNENGKEVEGNGERFSRKIGALYLDNLFWGRSNFTRLLMICVCLVSSLRAVSAAPSFFDEYGRSHFNPLNCGCTGSGSKRARVVGGSELEEGSAPWLAAITKAGRAHCGATLVTTNHLLSAAHCIDGVHLSDLRGWLGVHALSDAQGNGKGRRFRSAYPHPQFQMNGFHNDIAILEFQQSVQFTTTIKPACIPARADEEYASRTAVVAGWGKTGEHDAPSDVPRQALVQVWARSKCKSAGYPAKKVAGEVLCAGLPKGGVDACQGDSGGPLVMEGPNGATEIIGVVSWGRGCARPNLPGIYTRVASYLPFLHSILASSC